MKHILLFILLFSQQAKVLVAQCHWANDQEKKVYNNLVSIFDKNFLSKSVDSNWKASDVKNAKDGLEVSDSKGLYGSPLFICNAYQYDFSLQLKENSPENKIIEDSTKWYDALYQKNVAPMMTDGQIDMKKFATLSQAEQDKISKTSNEILVKKQLLLDGKAIDISTHINSPLLLISSPRSGFVASEYKKINVSGCTLAYAISLEPGTVSLPCRILLGFGKWPQKIVNHYGELSINYQFVHHFPSAVIENFVVQIDVPNINEGMKLVRRIDWTAVREALTNSDE
jgi:hypothetical protein